MPEPTGGPDDASMPETDAAPGAPRATENTSPQHGASEHALPAQEPKGASLGRATAVMSAGTAVSRITGFIRLAVMAWAIGGAESKLPDAYNLANSLPNMVYQLVIGEVLATLFVPVFVEYLTTREREESWRLASTILNLSLIVSGLFVALSIIFAPWILKLFSLRYTPDDVAAYEATGTFLIRLLMPQMIFYAMGMVLTGILNAHKRFGPAMFAPILNNLIVIATFVTFRVVRGDALATPETITTTEKLILGGGTTLGVIAMTMVLWPFVRSLPGRYQVRVLDWRHPAIAKVGKLARYSLAYVVVNQAGLWVVTVLANGERGGLSAYNTSWIIYQLPYGIFAVSVMTYIIREIAEHHVHGDVDAVRADLSRGLRTTAFIVLPAAAGFVALSEPLMRLFLEHGHFEALSTRLFARTFLFMALGLGAYTAFQQIMRSFYAMQDTRTPWLVNIGAVAAQIAVAWPLYGSMGVAGLGLAHAISYVVGAIVGGMIMRKRLGGIDGTRLASSYARIAVASVATGVTSFVVARAVAARSDISTFQGQLGQVALAVTAGLAVYAALTFALRVGELRALMGMIGGRLARRSS